MKVKQLLSKMTRYSTIDTIEVCRANEVVHVYSMDDIMERNYSEYGDAKIYTFAIMDKVLVLHIE